MAGAYQNRGPILNYSMGFLIILIIVVWAYMTILGWATIGRSEPQIAWYITGGLISLPLVALTLFTADFMVGEYSPSIYRDPALITFILNLGAVVPLVFMIWWYWDLGVRCEQGGVKSIEAPMCTSGGSGQVIIVWSMAAVSTVLGLFTLFVLVLSFADLYFRRLRSVTEATIGAAKAFTPPLLKGQGGPKTPAEEDIFEGAGEDLDSQSRMRGDLLDQLGLDSRGRVSRKSQRRSKKSKRR